jgi:hypothetical protein
LELTNGGETIGGSAMNDGLPAMDRAGQPGLRLESFALCRVRLVGMVRRFARSMAAVSGVGLKPVAVN